MLRLADVGAVIVLGGLLTQQALAQGSPSDGVYFPTAVTQTQADAYTRYDLLAPGTASFKIDYEVSATTSGARVFYNPIRKGSVASDEHVYDAMLGKPLHFTVVSGTEARKDPLMPDADPGMWYIKVTLARPVPRNGEARIVIVKTYRDPRSYYMDGKTLVFKRSLGIKRNKVVLPPGYEVVGLNVPSQILTQPDGRVAISFLHPGSGQAPLLIRAVKDAQQGAAARPRPATDERSWESPFEGETEIARLSERAHQDRTIVYFLQQPQTHSFKLYHEYTETRAGVDAYANVIRAGSIATHPSAVIVDTGEPLPTREMTGAQVLAQKINVGEPILPTSRLIVIPFAALKPGETRRLRITETYTAPASYRLEGKDLVFDRSLGRTRNAIVLPSGWYCTESSIPATVSQLPDRRVRLDYWDDRPEPVVVLLKARRRVGA